MKPFGDAFVKLIKMVIAPVIFCTVVTGSPDGSMKAVGRTGAVALLYFEVVSTIALIIGLIIVNVVQPGAGMNVDPSTLDAKRWRCTLSRLKIKGSGLLLDVIPAASLAPSPAATFCRFCSPSCLVLPCTVWAARAS